MMSRPPQSWYETGIASWYGPPYHGRRAANGEIYDMEKMTAAHRTLPFDTYVKVTSEVNGKSAVVRITDRGPFIDGRIIDLSKAAARSLDMIGPGLMKVRLEVSNAAPLEGGAHYGVQVGAFLDRRRAERLKESLTKRYDPVRIIERMGDRSQWRVVAGDRPTTSEALELAAELRAEYPDALVVRLDESPSSIQ